MKNTCINGEYNIKYHEFKLKNGLHIIYHVNNLSPIVSVSMLYHVGSKNDFSGLSGLAHFTEHMMFEETNNIKKGEFFKYISYNGGYNNAYTTQDETNYYSVVPSDKLEVVLWLESERMYNIKINNSNITTQKNIIIEEKKMRIDNRPYAAAFDEQIPNLIFKYHTYKNSVIGKINNIMKINLDDLNKFYSNYYSPNNAVLSISGNINEKLLFNYINKYFNLNKKSNFKYNNNYLNIEPFKNNSEKFCSFLDKSIKVPAIILAYKTFGISHKDYYVLNVINSILSSGNTSRIKLNIIDKKRYATYANSFIDILEDFGMFIIYAIPNINISLDKINIEFNNEINRLKNELIPKNELDKHINMCINSLLYKKQSMLDISLLLSKYYIYNKNTSLINYEEFKYKNITSHRILDISNKYFSSKNKIRLYCIPN